MTWLRCTTRTLLVLPLLLTTQACAGLQAILEPVPAHDTAAVACSSFAIIHEDPKTDTLETIKQIRQNNAAYHSLCDHWGAIPWGQPK